MSWRREDNVSVTSCGLKPHGLWFRLEMLRREPYELCSSMTNPSPLLSLSLSPSSLPPHFQSPGPEPLHVWLSPEVAGRLLVRQPHRDQWSPLQPPQKAGEQTHQPGERQEVQVHRWEEMSSHTHTWNTHKQSRLWRLINDIETRGWNVKNTCSFMCAMN